MLTEAEKKWLEERKLPCNRCKAPKAECDKLYNSKGSCWCAGALLKPIGYRLNPNYSDAAEFEARVAVKLARSAWKVKPCALGMCPISVERCKLVCEDKADALPHCRLLLARFAVEAEMEMEGK